MPGRPHLELAGHSGVDERQRRLGGRQAAQRGAAAREEAHELAQGADDAGHELEEHKDGDQNQVAPRDDLQWQGRGVCRCAGAHTR